MADKINQHDENEKLRDDVFDSSSQVYRNSYFEAAARIYGEVFIDNERNIGGQVTCLPFFFLHNSLLNK